MRLPPILVAVLLLAACGGEDRPGAQAWRAEWEAARALVPAAEAFEEDDAAERCGEFLGAVRTSRQELLPGPNETVDEAFTDWVEQAEALGLDCRDDTQDVDERLAELEEIAARVDRLVGASR